MWSRGKKSIELIKIDKNIGIPPALGIIPSCVFAGCLLFLLSVTKPHLFDSLITKGVKKIEIKAENKMIRSISRNII
jgi:hypothetical protein